MTSTPDRAKWATLAAACALVLGAPLAATPATSAVERARAALVQGDGIAAEARLRQALIAGARRAEVAAYMGEAQLAQGDYRAARAWLAPGAFSPAMRGHGFRMLGRLEQREGNLPAAGRAYDRALEAAPESVQLWIDIGRLRLAGGEQREAVEATEHALTLAPGDPEALGFRAVLIRSQYGPVASLPWFEAALAKAPDAPDLLADYAATLGDIGRAGAMLEATRRLYRASPGDPRAFYFQAVLGARAGKDALARRILERGGARVGNVPGAILLAGVLDLRAGNVNLAAERFERLLKAQPDNPHAQRLLARALTQGGKRAEVTRRFATVAQRPDASPYILALVGHTYEEQGRSDLAAPFLARSKSVERVPPVPLEGAPADVRGSAVATLRSLLSQDRDQEATQLAADLRAAHPGSADALLAAGDVALHAGSLDQALGFYDTAARIRFSEHEASRLAHVLRAMNRDREANAVVLALALENPAMRGPVLLLADAHGRNGRRREQARLLEWLGARPAPTRVAASRHRAT
jgi:tetratricopeptide (TPR) repeat protein